jgi:membrane associated rhomboid family serine protease
MQEGVKMGSYPVPSPTDFSSKRANLAPKSEGGLSFAAAIPTVDVMLSDRSYMRDEYSRPATSVLTWLLCAMVAGFVLQHVLYHWFPGTRASSLFNYLMSLTVEGARSGYVWTLLSYAFLHSTKNFLHILGNLLALFFLGRALLPILGERRLLMLFFGGVLGGAVLWLATNWGYGGAVIGASAGVLALLITFACINPNQPITLLLFFVLPVTLKPKWIALGVLAWDGIGFLFYEVMGRAPLLGYAHSAHLGGMAAGWLFFRLVYRRFSPELDRSPSIEVPRWFRRAKAAPVAPAYQVNVTPPPTREDLRAEVDRILDKINAHGFAALTAEEKRRLDEAKNLLSRQ